MDDFARAFHQADRVLVLDIYGASEKPIPGVTAEALVERMRQFGHRGAEYAGSNAAGVEMIVEGVEPGDMILTLGAGSVSQLGRQDSGEVELMPRPLAPPKPKMTWRRAVRRVFLGAGCRRTRVGCEKREFVPAERSPLRVEMSRGRNGAVCRSRNPRRGLRQPRAYRICLRKRLRHKRVSYPARGAAQTSAGSRLGQFGVGLAGMAQPHCGHDHGAHAGSVRKIARCAKFPLPLFADR